MKEQLGKYQNQLRFLSGVVLLCFVRYVGWTPFLLFEIVNTAFYFKNAKYKSTKVFCGCLIGLFSVLIAVNFVIRFCGTV